MKKLLIYIIAYNTEKFITNVLDRISIDLTKKYDVEILINDDSSLDRTFKIIDSYTKENKDKFNFKILSNPKNQGYGGNQKIGYFYALKNNFDFVALLHGDGQYAPEYLDSLIEPLHQENIDAVFGSRMLISGNALKGGMPLYKYVGNKILTWFQNFLLKTNLSEFHSGYRIYKVSSMGKVPYQLNANNFCFDTDIIIQFVINKLKIKELPIPTYYADQISYVNGPIYAIQICISTIRAKLQNLRIFSTKKFKINNEKKLLALDEENEKLEKLFKLAENNAKNYNFKKT